MELTGLDIGIFVLFFIAVIIVGLMKSRHEKSSEDYFLAGRGLNWWLIGFSLIAANISAEQFVGMSGQAAKDSIGLAVASFEWIAAVVLVLVAFFFLPTFLRSGIYTIPEYLEHRFNRAARLVMSILMLIIYVGVTIATVIYLGAKALEPLFEGTLLGLPINIVTLSWIVGIVAAIYVGAGGLKACVWADLIQGSALIAGGAVVMVLALMALNNPGSFEGTGAVEAINSSLGLGEDASLTDKLLQLKELKMHMVLPRTSSFLPWTALLIGIWIPNVYYWGLNQYIMQRTLGASALAEGQRGVVFAALLKLIIPFIVCVPGIIAFTLYSGKMQENAMNDPRLNAPVLAVFKQVQEETAIDKLFPFDSDFAQLQPELAAEIFAYNQKVAGVTAAVSEDMSVVNSRLIENVVESNPSKSVAIQQILVGYDYDGAFPLLIRYLTPVGLRGFVLAALMGAVISSLASMLNAASTIFTMDIYGRCFNKNAKQETLIRVGRVTVALCVVIGCLIAPQLANPKYRGAFSYIQEFQGFVSPGILTVFMFGLFVRSSPRISGVVGLVLSPVIYGVLYVGWSDMAFLNRMAISVVIISIILAILTLLNPLRETINLPTQTKISMEQSKGARNLGLAVVALTVILYIIFW